jgi:parallel beta-helix repeat protein
MTKQLLRTMLLSTKAGLLELEFLDRARRTRLITCVGVFAAAILGTGIQPSTAAPASKVEVCHLPPGNPGNAHTITISTNALTAHLAHGDYAGSCQTPEQCDIVCNDLSLCTTDRGAWNPTTYRCDCSYTTVDCDDTEICTTDSCEPTQGCVYTSTVGTSCNDGDICTSADSCNAQGQCEGSAIVGCCLSDGDCTDGQLCTTDTCNLTTYTCEHSGVTCTPDPNDMCHIAACNEANSGTCETAEISCDDNDDTTMDTCDPGTGCVHTPITEITSCAYRIDSPGQYRLAADLSCSTGDGIGIGASDVDLNLNGHTISGSGLACGGSTTIGIAAGEPDDSNVHIHNGTVTGFYIGIQISGHDHHANRLTVTGNCEGMRVVDSDNNYINENNASGNVLFGVLVNRSNDNEFNANVANNTGGICCGGGGFFLVDSDGNVINFNDMSSNQNNPGVRLINSHNNTIQGNTANGNSSELGILIDAGSTDNFIQGNTALGNALDLGDANIPLGCLNTWESNTFVTDNEVGPSAGPGAGCIQ